MSFGGPRSGQMRPLATRAYVYAFHDHAQQPALLVFRNLTDSTLPPLASFAIYFTGETANLTEDLAQQALVDIETDSLVESKPFRLELFQLPGASVEACVDHHRSERIARGDYGAQLEAIRNNQRPGPAQGANESDVFHKAYRPGLPPSYLSLPGEQCYHQLFFICHDRLEHDSVELVQYDPLSPPEYARWCLDSPDPADDPDRAILSPCRSGDWKTIKRSRSPTIHRDGSGNGIRSVAEVMSFHGNFDGVGEHEEGTAGPFQAARRRGWQHW